MRWYWKLLGYGFFVILGIVGTPWFFVVPGLAFMLIFGSYCDHERAERRRFYDGDR